MYKTEQRSIFTRDFDHASESEINLDIKKTP